MSNFNRMTFANGVLLAMTMTLLLTGCQWNNSEEASPKNAIGPVAITMNRGMGMCCSPGSASRSRSDATTIKGNMNMAMRSGLCGKVANGTASEDEKKQLVALFTHLAATKCPKGDPESWKAKTTVLLEAAQSGNADALRKAANCKNCHSEHK